MTSTLVDFYVGKFIHEAKDKKRKKHLLWVSLLVNLGILGFFKYFNFFVDSFQSAFGTELDFLHLSVILPVGISFYTFQTMSYTIDIYKGELKPTNSLMDFALFVSFFPQLVAGPIERAKSLLPQLGKRLATSKIQIKEGINLIVMGLFRKVIIGDTSGRFVDHIFNDLYNYNSIEIAFAVLIFGIQIYADFSGYSKIARGVAKLLGVELMVNFSQPYLSRNITEFWRRWHISLSKWLRDYLYIPLGGNRKDESRTYINLMVTMLLGGLWHGASWNFVIWGALHGVYLAIHKYYLKRKSRSIKQENNLSLKDISKVIATFGLVSFTWLFFRSTSWESTEQIFSKFLEFEISEYTFLFLQILIAYYSISFLLDYFEYKYGQNFIFKIKNKAFSYGVLTMIFAITLLYMFQADPLPFIYFQF
jgi:D-alanyl-lipoteichoic acid acyltransferase DltB (MBOAT superfamily)